MRLYLKDYFTLASLAAGLVSIVLAGDGELQLACFFVWVAFVFDTLDGTVARLTGKKNALGGHLDAIVDFVGCALAPSMCIWLAYKPMLGWYGALALGCVPTLLGAVRHARNYANPPEVRNLWVGLPRSYSGMGFVGLLGGSFFGYEWVQYGGIAYIFVLSYLGITTVPYQGRHHRGLKWHQKLFFIMTISTWIVGLVIWGLGYGLEAFFDGQFGWMTGYTLLGYIGMIPKDELEEYYRYINEEWLPRFKEMDGD